MASIRSKSSMALPLAVMMIVLPCCFTLATAFGRKVGGRMEVKGVETNQEVQELGRFSVEEHNLRLGTTNGQIVIFSHVVAAETQVVAGIKYYLKIEARQHGETKVFESVVVVKPWLRSKEMLAFSPSTSYTSSF